MALLPARHWLYPGDVLVTNEGHYFSWMLMMRTLDCDFMVKLEDAETGKQTLHDPRRFLPKEKYKMVAASPYRIWQYTRQLSAVYKKEGRVVPEMYIEHRAVVNGKDVSPVVKPGFDLAREPFPFFRHARWISP
jgi:hypothetical protein